MSKSSYYNRPEWSYSQMKVILDSGIDYAVAKKRGDLPQPSSAAIDLGQLVHQLVLGGNEQFIVSPYTNFMTKEAREWRKSMQQSGVIVITKEQGEIAERIAKHIGNHPHAAEYLIGEHTKHEVELYAKTADGIDLRGKADAIVYKDDDKTPKFITDIKTTAQFDKFAKTSMRHHYDLQSAVYTLIAGNSNAINYFFCVAETVEPYRVQFMHASLEFLESGERKLRHCVDEIKKFGNKEPSFLLDEVTELGDWSL